MLCTYVFQAFGIAFPFYDPQDVRLAGSKEGGADGVLLPRSAARKTEQTHLSRIDKYQFQIIVLCYVQRFLRVHSIPVFEMPGITQKGDKIDLIPCEWPASCEHSGRIICVSNRLQIVACGIHFWSCQHVVGSGLSSSI